ncbi:MAG: 2-C-methyl-D-erythritol 4-phosphate cytidylyltransferase [Burkholderiales bacterium]|nr:MAG: 2-C-methyl-D-erythritol 4-phosphate cytidylyltransferase [Burkholderiales bacterium]
MPPSSNPRIFALIPCGGVGSRSGEGLPKQYREIAGLPMVAHTLAAFAHVPRISSTAVVISPYDTLFAQHVSLPSTSFFIAPCAGPSRATTVFLGIKALLEQRAKLSDWVLVHDAARCLITPDQINAVIDACLNDDVGGLMALKLPDTLKQETAGRVTATVARSDKWLAQTPQMFRIDDLITGQYDADASDIEVTDESSLIELLGKKPKLIPGSAQNFKVTYPEDFALAEAVLRSRQA